MMESKRVFPLYVWLLVGLLTITSFTLPLHFDISYPAPLGPQFDARSKIEHLEYIEAHRPEMVLIGDSQLYLGVDQEQLSGELGAVTYKIAIPGSGSAVWYLLMKNSVAESSYAPHVVVVVFRDTLLTVPAYRATGRYFDLVDDYARRNEPLLLERAYLNQMGPLEKAAEQYFPLYSARREIREGVDGDLRYALPSLLGCASACVDNAINTVFGRERLDPAALSQAIDAAQQTMFTPAALDFSTEVGRSFLPEMIRIAQERGIRLVFVRLKTLIYPMLATQPPALREYISLLGAYLAQKDAVLLDFGQDERIQPEYFFDELHFTAEGMGVFTHLLAEELQPILAER